MRTHKALALITLAAVLAVPAVAAAQGMARVAGTVVDAEGEPIEGVTITVTSPELSSYESVKTTNRKGKFTTAHPDAAIPYVFTFEKEGFLTLELPVQVAPGGTMRQTFTLLPEGQAAPPQGAAGAQPEGRPSRVVEVYNEGVEAQQLGDLELAKEKYLRAAEIDADLAAPHTALAAVAFLQEDWQAAAAHAEAALERDPGDVRALQIRFDAYRRAGDEEKAKEAADALREIGDLEEAAKRLYNEAVDAYNKGDIAAAQSRFEQVVELDPQLATAHRALAQIYLQQGSPTAAAEAAEAATAVDPDDTGAWKLLFDAARLSGNDELAQRALDRVAELDPKWIGGVLFDHATELYNEGSMEMAAAELARVVESRPDLARAHYFHGMALFNLGRTDEARTALETFIELAPDDPEAKIAEEMLSYMD